MRIAIALVILIGEEREDGGQNHCAPTIGITFRKGKASELINLLYFLNE